MPSWQNTRVLNRAKHDEREHKEVLKQIIMLTVGGEDRCTINREQCQVHSRDEDQDQLTYGDSRGIG